MRIGQIVFIDDKNLPNVQTGIITKREKEPQASYFWYEVLCNDGQNYVIPGFLLSPAARDRSAWYQRMHELQKYFKNCAQLYKTHKNPVTLYT